MDDHQREINKAKKLYAAFTCGRFRVIEDTEGMPVANKAPALELMHESEQTIPLWLSGAAIIVAAFKFLFDLMIASPKSETIRHSAAGASPQQVATPAATP